MNSLKNELEIELTGEKILLRPSFENLYPLEKQIGGLDNISYDLARGERENKSRMLSVTDATSIIFHCQEPKKYKLEEIHERVLSGGISARSQLYTFLMHITTGDKAAAEITENQKKS